MSAPVSHPPTQRQSSKARNPAAQRHERLRRVVAAACEAASRTDRPQWVLAYTPCPSVDALAVFSAWQKAERYYWERPSEGRAIATLGEIHAIETDGAARFEQAAHHTEELFAAIHREVPQPATAPQPLLVGGFAFAHTASKSELWRNFPAGRLVLPEVIFQRTGDRAGYTVGRKIDPGSDVAAEYDALDARLTEVQRQLETIGRVQTTDTNLPAEGTAEYHTAPDRPHTDYRERVSRALDSIAAGEIEKVVLARTIRVHHQTGFEPTAILDALRCAYPSCVSFAIAKPEGLFLGATPERLIRLTGRRAETAAVAGSAPRGRSPDADARLAHELLEDSKERMEHAIVVDALRTGLGAHCVDLEAPNVPRVLQLDGIQHLETPIAGTLRTDVSILELVGELHPSPAVAGAPRSNALAWLTRWEDLDRGWYAGPVGFIDTEGGGEFCAALRSAVLRGPEAHLFTGAGIVAGSHAEAELRETRLKARVLLAPLLEV